ncbi:MAG: hypothetical protein DRJ14_03590 [Acidobacteria bacterium]|nr:MAG: hypothetical protein DRJ14_03590 [Acidobacteriota bacterium]
MDLHLSVILGRDSGASFIHVDEGVRSFESSGNFASPLTLPKTLVTAVRAFSTLVTELQKRGVRGKVELFEMDKHPVIRAKRPAPGVSYRFFQPDTAAKAVAGFLRRRPCFKKPAVQLEKGVFNLLIGRNGDKFLHEWLSHPAESGVPLPPDVTLFSVNPHFYSKKRPRLVRGRIRCSSLVPLPDSWLLLRTIQNGRYDSGGQRVSFSIAEAFLKKDSLIQSLYPARVSVELKDLNRGFPGCLSEKELPGAGFICSKFGENVFGRIEAPPLLFTEIPIEVEA